MFLMTEFYSITINTLCLELNFLGVVKYKDRST